MLRCLWSQNAEMAVGAAVPSTLCSSWGPGASRLGASSAMALPKRRRQPGGQGVAPADSVKPPNALESILESIAQLGLQQPYAALQRARRQPEGVQKPPGGAKRLPPSARATAVGSVLFGLLVFLAGAFPYLLPHAFLLFCVTALPWRLWSYAVAEPVNVFYLADFCYWVSAAAFIFLLAPPAARDARLEAAIYAVADGPVAWALVAWECAWVWASADHSISVLLHLLPGLAMFAHRHLPRLTSWQQLAACAGNLRDASTILRLGSCIADSDAGERGVLQKKGEILSWLFVVPLAFYTVWQVTYFCVVQVLCGRLIKRRGLDTSYKCLVKRGAKANTLLSRIVLRKSRAHRLLMYGLLQLAFTVATLMAFLPTYFSFRAALAWQLCKFLLPIHFGAKYTCERLIKAGIADGIKQYQAHAQRMACQSPAPNKEVTK